MRTKLCTIDGCDTKQLARGFCSKHYQRARLHGEIEIANHERHGGHNDRAYVTWRAMRYRCNNPNDIQYKDYGGRGIKVCERWQKSYSMFLEDMGERPEGMTIDRIDHGKDYSPENCRWSTQSEQCRNKRNNHMLTIYGKTMPLVAWHEIVAHDTSYDSIKRRLYRGWTDKQAVFGKLKAGAIAFVVFTTLFVQGLSAQINGSACKINQSRWCGSGSLAGYAEDGSGAYILTNAHVSSTNINDPFDCLFKMPDGSERRFSCDPMIIAYNPQSVDWCIGFIDGLTVESGIIPLKLSKDPPGSVGSKYNFTGSPRCAWPLQTFEARIVAGAPSGVVFFLENSIGGQSGSSLWREVNGKRQAEILLTWSYGGRGRTAKGAGQPTSLIYHNIVNKSTAGPAPLEGLVEMSFEDRDLTAGYFEDESTNLGDGLVERAALVSSLPIWIEDHEPTEPDDPVDPPTSELTTEETAAAVQIKAMGYDLPSVAKLMGQLMKTPEAANTEELPLPKIHIDEGQGVWIAPKGPDLYEGMIHKGRILKQLCDPVTLECHYEWVLIN